MSQPSDEDWEKHDRAVQDYLVEYAKYVERKSVIENFWSRARTLLLAFTNDKGGAPADGVLVRLHFPEGPGLRVFEASALPQDEEAPVAPSPPSPRSVLDAFAPLGRIDYASLGSWRGIPSLPNVRVQSNVSGPKFGKGSIRVEYQIEEILHNVPESNKDDALVVFFERSGRWEVPYEVHARNLQVPRTGKLLIEARYDEEPPKWSVPDDLLDPSDD